MSTNTQQPCPAHRTQTLTRSAGQHSRSHDFVLRRITMFCSRCLLPALALYLLLEELSAFLLPGRVRRNAEWLDQESSPHWSELSDLTDLFPGDSGEMTQDWGSRTHQPSAFLTPLERLPTSQHATRTRRRQKHKRVTAPLDSIGGGLLSSHHSRKDEPADIWE